MNNVSLTANEVLITEVTNFISELVPIHVDEIKNKLSAIFSKYHIKKVESDETHPDLTENISLFLSSKKLEGLSETTLKSYKLELGIFSSAVKKRTSDINAADIRVFLSSFEELKMSSVGRKLSVLKSFFSFLSGEEIINRDPTARIKPPKKEKRTPKALTIEELEMLREGCNSNRQRALIEVLYATGARLSEVQALDVKSIDQQSMSAKVIGKGNKERTVYFSFKAMFHLNKYLKSRKESEDKALFLSFRKPYSRLSNRGIQREVAKVAKQAGVKNVSPHALRHTFATLTLNNGAELAAVQALLGHESPETTLIYSQLTDDNKYQAYKKHLVQ